MRSFPLPAAGNTGSRPDLRLRYFRVGGSLPTAHRRRNGRLLACAIRNGLRLDPALARNAPCGRETLQAIHRRPHHVVRIRGAEALRQNIADSRALERSEEHTSELQ